MKKIGTLALTLALAGSMTVPALAAEETAVPISADTGYGTALVLNGETWTAWPWWAASPLSPPTCLTAGRATR